MFIWKIWKLICVIQCGSNYYTLPENGDVCPLANKSCLYDPIACKMPVERIFTEGWTILKFPSSHLRFSSGFVHLPPADSPNPPVRAVVTEHKQHASWAKKKKRKNPNQKKNGRHVLPYRVYSTTVSMELNLILGCVNAWLWYYLNINEIISVKHRKNNFWQGELHFLLAGLTLMKMIYSYSHSESEVS